MPLGFVAWLNIRSRGPFWLIDTSRFREGPPIAREQEIGQVFQRFRMVSWIAPQLPTQPTKLGSVAGARSFSPFGLASREML